MIVEDGTSDVVGVYEDKIGEVANGGSRGNVTNVVNAGGDDGGGGFVVGC